jgi:outer membrane protein TolC
VSLLLVVLRLPDAMLRIFFLALALSMTAAAFAQQTFAAPPASITLEQAIALARANEPNFAAAAANARVAALDHSIAQAALLPNVSYHNQVLYTQPNGAFNFAGPAGSQSAPRFIANNAIREYASPGVV